MNFNIDIDAAMDWAMEPEDKGQAVKACMRFVFVLLGGAVLLLATCMATLLALGFLLAALGLYPSLFIGLVGVIITARWLFT